jgi:hypothetical protein
MTRGWLLCAARAALLLLTVAAATAAAAEPLPEALRACASIPQDQERLMCFDREVAALSGGASRSAATPEAAAPLPATSATAAPAARAGAAAAGTGVAEASAVSSAAPVSAAPVGEAAGTAQAPLSPEQRFGLSLEGLRKLESREGIKSAELKRLDAHVKSVYHNAAGRQVFTLDNGQVWRQAETKPDFEAGPGAAVTISSGALGSYWLQTSKHNWTRVERVL